ncbi:hypothetical protein SNEBB_001480 [Seison nebaliae]|nr:hypothetical protein SNEBB_001480 [Seison nebaliae]
MVRLLLLSGKRKSGKDFWSEKFISFCEEHGIKIQILRLSAPLKYQYALDHNLDFNELLSHSKYKEQFRYDMIKWGEDKRKEDRYVFCRLIENNMKENVDIYVIVDCRRLSDYEYFEMSKEKLKDTKNIQEIIHIRIIADEISRIQRGFIFTKGIDDAESECNLDLKQNWNFEIDNSKEYNELDYERKFNEILKI